MKRTHQVPLKPAIHAERHELARARERYRQRQWAGAYEGLTVADGQAPLEAEDIELLALAAYLTGRDDEYLAVLERAHHAHLNAGQCARAVRCAFWLGFRLLMRGETGRATGWLSRAERLLEQEPRDCAERGYVLLPAVERRLQSGDLEGAYDMATDIAAIGERCRDLDLTACARHQQGRSRLQQGQVERGLALLDETMVAVISGELSPLVTGLLYCSVIDACQRVYAIDRSREWTAALARWCQGQPDLVPFSGVCQVHRAEILIFQGAWPEALEAAQRAYARSRDVNPPAAAAAHYQQAEIHRLKGDFAAAEDAYRSASHLGLEPQPGLALLRLAQQRTDSAVAAIRCAVNATTDRQKLMSLLPAYVEIALASGNIEDARKACRELQEIAKSFDTGVPAAMAAQACGAVDLAEGDAQSALVHLRRAFAVWQRLEALYAAACVRVLVGLACHTLGDKDGAGLEIDAARAVFSRLGAAPDLTRVDTLMKSIACAGAHGLTPRELQVLRLVAAGESNKAAAGKLSLSEKTIERHVSNILTKLGVPSRTAATTFAHRHKLV
jgi:DNA-binding CsgD family transcriptional regulator/tetratricopeptide (TPR) repeat protein